MSIQTKWSVRIKNLLVFLWYCLAFSLKGLFLLQAAKVADEVLTAVGGVRKKVEKLRSAKQEKVKVRFLYLEPLLQGWNLYSTSFAKQNISA